MKVAISIAAMLALAACAASHATTQKTVASPAARGPVFADMGAAPPMDLRDAVSGEALPSLIAGKVVLVSFVTTTCKEACPVVESKFAAAQEKLARDRFLGTRVHLVLVGMDPVEDTPHSLAALATKFHARAGAFHFAAGDAAHMRRVLHDYGIEVSYHGASHIDPDHTVAIFLIDPDRRLRYDFAMYYPPDVIARITEQLAMQTTR